LIFLLQLNSSMFFDLLQIFVHIKVNKPVKIVGNTPFFVFLLASGHTFRYEVPLPLAEFTQIAHRWRGFVIRAIAILLP